MHPDIQANLYTLDKINDKLIDRNHPGTRLRKAPLGTTGRVRKELDQHNWHTNQS